MLGNNLVDSVERGNLMSYTFFVMQKSSNNVRYSRLPDKLSLLNTKSNYIGNSTVRRLELL